MSLPTKIVVIGAGSVSFGENTLAALMRSQKLHGSTLALVDRNQSNLGQIENLPLGATVETPVAVNGKGIQPVHVGTLPEPIAELCRREITVAQLCVDAAIEGSRQKALQCLLLDSVVTDIDMAKKILDDYLTTYQEYLPQFRK